MANARMVAVSIGVSNYPTLQFLGGAVNSAHRFYNWAKALAYDSILLTDEDEALTITRLREALETQLSSQDPIRRLVIYFAGHGLIREAGEGLWLLSDWNEELRAVAVEGLKRRLYKYNVGQIAFFADSCRNLPPTLDTSDLVADAVLGRGPNNPLSEPMIDKFIAAQDGASAFVLNGKNPQDDICLFTGVLLEGLWGQDSTAYSTLRPNEVTSGSLGEYLRKAVPLTAKRYNCSLYPSVSPTFPEGEDVYYKKHDDPTLAPSDPIVWPDPPMTPPGPPPRAAGPSPYIETDAPVRGARIAQMEFPDAGPFNVEPADISLFAQMKNQPPPTHFETGAGFLTGGASVRDVWTPKAANAQPDQPGWWRLFNPEFRLVQPSHVLIQTAENLFAGFSGMPNFAASILFDRRGVSAIVYRMITAFGVPGTYADTSALVQNAIASMDSGDLRPENAVDLALELRKFKHMDPMLGVIAAYLYDALDDQDSIRKIAYFYAEANQPIPYDIALLAHLKAELRNDILHVTVPEMKSSKPRTPKEEQLNWSYRATPQTSGWVGGRWPWMRQGWALLDDELGSLVPGALPGLATHLTQARFTTMDEKGGRALIRIFNLHSNLEKPAPLTPSAPVAMM